MSKVLFVWPVYETDQGIQNGIAQMSAILKRAGHEVQLIMPGDDLDYFAVVKKVRTLQPDFIGFSATALQRKHVFALAGFIRGETKAPLIVGGVDVILNRYVYTDSDLFDYVCIGEGEKGILEVVSGEQSPTNFLTKCKTQHPKSVTWEAGEKESFSYDKSTPAEDYDIFPWHHIMKKRNGWVGDFFIGRGCPYNCTHCSNHVIRKNLFPENPKDYVRFKDVDKVLWEIQWGVERYDDPQMIVFGDDTFTLNLRYMQKFLPFYKDRIGLPFVCNVRPGTLNDAKARLLKWAGCAQVKIGIEHGNEALRKGLLKRPEDNDKIRETFRIASENGLETSAFLMIGLPDETLELVDETLQFVAELQPDRFKYSVFYPFPGTELYDYCITNDLINWKVYESLENYSTDSGLKFNKAMQVKIKLVMKDVGKAVNHFADGLPYWIAHKDFMAVKRR